MYNRSPYAAIRVSDGIDGSLMGRTLGVLALLLAILAAAALLSPLAGTLGLWIGIGAALVGTIMVGRSMASAGRAFAWGAVVAIGMGLLVGPVVWSVAVTNLPLLLSTLGILLVAVLFSALLVSVVPWDFSRLAPLLFLGLIMLIVTSLLSWFVPSMTGLVVSRAYNLIGTLIFIGYLLVDFSLMRVRGRLMPAEGTAVVLAVSILVDIVNLFLFLLRLGRR
ncbi:MAG: Bax inhibitor-1 family protein [Firmicutes bacterium]|nr:Bax inhibitor-1 family protein [Bacillota bacterium]